MENTLVRTRPCAECGAEVLWTQNAWKSGDSGAAAYRCLNGHVIDPAQTRQCPACGVHDTERLADANGLEQFQCRRCGTAFTFPH